MQLDRTRITIRERTTFEVFDLSLQVLRTFVWPLLGWLLVGALPWAILNHWVLSEGEFFRGPYELNGSHTWWMLFLVAIEMPLATAPLTLYLGRVLFLESPTRHDILGNWLRSLPQMLLLQTWPLVLLLLCLSSGDLDLINFVLILIILPVLFYRCAFRPYLNEIILLERNPLRATKTSPISTRRRSKALHSWSRGELFERFLASLVTGLFLTGQLVCVAWGAKAWLSGTVGLSPLAYMILLQMSLWIVVGLFGVVRFLCYLDLRIRREGWEVDLRMRAEAARLSEELF